jgi:hypothetical protein
MELGTEMGIAMQTSKYSSPNLSSTDKTDINISSQPTYLIPSVDNAKVCSVKIHFLASVCAADSRTHKLPTVVNDNMAVAHQCISKVDLTVVFVRKEIASYMAQIPNVLFQDGLCFPCSTC